MIFVSSHLAISTTSYLRQGLGIVQWFRTFFIGFHATQTMPLWSGCQGVIVWGSFHGILLAEGGVWYKLHSWGRLHLPDVMTCLLLCILDHTCTLSNWIISFSISWTNQPVFPPFCYQLFTLPGDAERNCHLGPSLEIRAQMCRRRFPTSAAWRDHDDTNVEPGDERPKCRGCHGVSVSGGRTTVVLIFLFCFGGGG